MNAKTGEDFADYRAWKSWDVQSFGKVDRVQARYFEAEFKAAGVALNAPLSLLEIGFGNASLAAWANVRGWTYCGTELDPELVARAKAAGLEAHTADAPLDQIGPDDGFDLIVAFDVLEHLTQDEIVDLLTELRKRLKPGGRLVARFPSGDSPFSGAIQNGDITHRTAIGSGMAEQLAARSGLCVAQIRATVFPLSGLGVRRWLRRLPVKLGRGVVNRTLQLIYFDHQARVLDPNMVIVLRVAPDRI